MIKNTLLRGLITTQDIHKTYYKSFLLQCIRNDLHSMCLRLYRVLSPSNIALRQLWRKGNSLSGITYLFSTSLRKHWLPHGHTQWSVQHVTRANTPPQPCVHWRTPLYSHTGQGLNAARPRCFFVNSRNQSWPCDAYKYFLHALKRQDARLLIHHVLERVRPHWTMTFVSS